MRIRAHTPLDAKKRPRSVAEDNQTADAASRKSKPAPTDEDEDDEPAVKRPRKSRRVVQDEEDDAMVDAKDTEPVEVKASTAAKLKTGSRQTAAVKDEEEVDDAPPRSEPPKRKDAAKPKNAFTALGMRKKDTKHVEKEDAEEAAVESGEEAEVPEEPEEDEDELEITDKARKTVQTVLTTKTQDPYPDWKPGEAVPYAALCKTFSLVELTTKRLEIMKHCSLFLCQVLRLTPEDLLPTITLMINKLAPDYAGIELGIGESLIMKAIGETTGRSLAVIKQDQKEIGDLGLVAVKSRSTQPTMFKPKALTVRGVHKGLIGIATITGNGAQQRKVDSIKKILSAADAQATGKVDISKDKGGPSEAKYIVRFLEGKLRLGLAERTVLVSLAQAMVAHEASIKGTTPSTSDIEKGEAMLKTVYRSVAVFTPLKEVKLTYPSELPSYDMIIPAMLEHGIMNLKENCQLRPGIPLKPMLAKPTKAITEVLDRFENQTFTCEYKYDGERAQIHYVAEDATEELSQALPGATTQVGAGVASIFSRNSEDLSKKYPDILAKLHTWVKEDTKSFVLDCETVAWDVTEKKVLPFQQLMTRKKKDVKIEEVKVKVCVFAFDLLYLNGEAVVEKPLRERRDLLTQAFNPVEGEFALATYMNGRELEEIQAFLDESVKASCEGLMVKMLDGAESGYEPSKRSRNWLKVGALPPFPSSPAPMLNRSPDQERLPLRHRRLAGLGRPGRLLRQRQAHVRVRGLPARVLQPGLGHVRDGVQHRHGLQRERARVAARAAQRHRHRPAQALLLALVGQPAPARRLVRATLRMGGAHRRPDPLAPLQGRLQGGRRPGRRQGHQPALPALHQAPRRQEARRGHVVAPGRRDVPQAGERLQDQGTGRGRRL